MLGERDTRAVGCRHIFPYPIVFSVEFGITEYYEPGRFRRQVAKTGVYCHVP